MFLHHLQGFASGVVNLQDLQVVKWFDVEILHDLPTAPEPGLTCSDFEKDELRLERQIFLVCS